MKTTVRQFFIFIFSIVIGGNLFAGIIEVPKDAETIQTGLNMALDNDTILVEPGYYVDNLNYLGKDVVVLAFAGPDQTTLYPADFGQPVVSFISDEPPSAKFIGFTVYGMPSNHVIFIDSGASPHIYNNIFHSNIIEGIYDKAVITNWSDSSNPVIEKNIFYGNLGLSAIWIQKGKADIFNNTIDGNRGAISCYSGLASMENNIITNCIGIAIEGDFLGFNYNIYWGNSANFG